jgi:DNA-binding response OmpR family regulator
MPRPTRRSRSIARVLVACSSRQLSRDIELLAGYGPFLTRTVDSAEKILPELASWKPDIVNVDADMEGGHAADVVLNIRDKHFRITALTRQPGAESRANLLNRSADDAMQVPPDWAEFVARLRAVARRAGGTQGESEPTIVLGALEVDITNRTVVCGGLRTTLTRTENEIPYLLAANAGEVLSRAHIANMVGGFDRAGSSYTVERHISSLRAKLAHCQAASQIKTVRGQGYTFVMPPAQQAS